MCIRDRCLDKETIENIDWGDKEVLLIRVADSPLGGHWKSHEMKGKDK